MRMIIVTLFSGKDFICSNVMDFFEGTTLLTLFPVKQGQ